MYPILYQIEGLFEDINFSTKVTRDTLEEICADLFRQVKNPVQDVLRSTGITMVRPHLLYMSTHWHFAPQHQLTFGERGRLQHITVALRHIQCPTPYTTPIH